MRRTHAAVMVRRLKVDLRRLLSSGVALLSWQIP
jgi:hypothetical protein